MQSSRLFFGALLIVVISTTYVFVRESALGPKFRVFNGTSQSVAVTAKWRDQSRNLGAIESGSTISLTVRDEASMVFSVQYADGREIDSTPVYFTSGITTNVSISLESIDVTQDVDT
jgi:hypothetical protein